ncbi:hypothetical protein SAMD00079811_03730 [Scytonema sp. HK-05]|nr:hypothetical protein SAMD00079811_03730 [Scytonema sp. HK-05]
MNSKDLYLLKKLTNIFYDRLIVFQYTKFNTKNPNHQVRGSGENMVLITSQALNQGRKSGESTFH